MFACDFAVDPLDVVLDLVSKFSTDINFVTQVSHLTDLPAKTHRSYSTAAYVVRVSNEQAKGFQPYWKKPAEPLDELLLPKVICNHQDSKSILNDKRSPFINQPFEKNGCFDL